MMGRRLLKAVCEKRHHVLVELASGESGHRILTIPRVAVATLRGEGVGRDVYLGGDRIDLDDVDDMTRWDQRRAGCRCGLSFLVSPAEIVRLADQGKTSTVLKPRRM